MGDASRLIVVIAGSLAGLVHVGFWVLEAVLWDRPAVHRMFGVTTREGAAAQRGAFYNIGWYNLLLALGAWVGVGLYAVHRGAALLVFAMAFMVAAALVLLRTARAMWRGALIQGLPAAVALAALAVSPGAIAGPPPPPPRDPSDHGIGAAGHGDAPGARCHRRRDGGERRLARRRRHAPRGAVGARLRAGRLAARHRARARTDPADRRRRCHRADRTRRRCPRGLRAQPQRGRAAGHRRAARAGCWASPCWTGARGSRPPCTCTRRATPTTRCCAWTSAETS